MKPDEDRVYRAVVDSIPDSLVLIQDDRIQLSNNAFRSLFGYTESDINRGLSFLDLVREQDVSTVNSRQSRVLSGERVSETLRVHVAAKGGTSVPCETYWSPLEYEGRPAVLVAIRNVTERVDSEKTLRNSEAMYWGLFESMCEGAYRTRPDGTIISANPALVRMLGFESEEELCSTMQAEDLYADPADRPAMLSELEAKGGFRDVELRLKRKDGCPITVLESARVVLDEKGKVSHYEGLLTEITDRKRAEEALRRSEELYRLLVESAGTPITLWDTDGNLLLINEVGARNLGGSPEDFVGKSLREVLPDQAEQFLKRNRQAIKKGKALEFADDLQLSTGRRWFSSSIQPVRDAGGEVFGVQIFSQDITDQKQAEERLRATHEQLHATLDALPDLLFETDREGRIHDFRAPNPEMLYCPPEEFTGKTVGQVLPSNASKAIMVSIRKAIESGRCLGTVYSLEIGGEERWFELSAVAKGAPRSAKCRVVALARDITDRKQGEDMLRKVTDDLRAERQELTEKNIALEKVLEHIDSQKQNYRRQVRRDLELALMPLFKSLQRQMGPGSTAMLEDVEAGLRAVLAMDDDEFARGWSRLTARESEICDMIKAGMSSKEIAEKLNLSLSTVHKHRENIREKFRLSGRHVSLATYLRVRA